jgi:Zn-dependent protease
MERRDAYNPMFEPQLQDQPRRFPLSFSLREVGHLALAVAALTVCFALILGDKGDGDYARKFQLGLPDPTLLVSSLLAASTGFILHELAHKIAAQRYGHWAEFRVQLTGLLVGLGTAAVAPFFAAAPGATEIRGRVTQAESGVVSIVGPAVNFVVACATWPFAWTLNPDQHPVAHVLYIIAFVNAGLAVLNMLPFWILDGRKIMRWRPAVWVVAMAASAALFLGIARWPSGF